MRPALLLALAAILMPVFAGEGTPAPYPFTTCIVSGEPLARDMGDPVVFIHEGREVKLCCASCRKKFINRAEEYVTIIDDGVRARNAGETPVNPAAAQLIARPPRGAPDSQGELERASGTEATTDPVGDVQIESK